MTRPSNHVNYRKIYVMTTSYTPNHIPAGERITNALFSVLLLLYGSYGIWINDIYILGKHGKGIHLHDVPAWIMYGAIACACLVMLSVVVDHLIPPLKTTELYGSVLELQQLVEQYEAQDVPERRAGGARGAC